MVLEDRHFLGIVPAMLHLADVGAPEQELTYATLSHAASDGSGNGRYADGPRNDGRRNASDGSGHGRRRNASDGSRNDGWSNASRPAYGPSYDGCASDGPVDGRNASDGPSYDGSTSYGPGYGRWRSRRRRYARDAKHR